MSDRWSFGLCDSVTQLRTRNHETVKGITSLMSPWLNPSHPLDLSLKIIFSRKISLSSFCPHSPQMTLVSSAKCLHNIVFFSVTVFAMIYFLFF